MDESKKIPYKREFGDLLKCMIFKVEAPLELKPGSVLEPGRLYLVASEHERDTSARGVDSDSQEIKLVIALLPDPIPEVLDIKVEESVRLKFKRGFGYFDRPYGTEVTVLGMMKKEKTSTVMTFSKAHSRKRSRAS